MWSDLEHNYSLVGTSISFAAVLRNHTGTLEGGAWAISENPAIYRQQVQTFYRLSYPGQRIATNSLETHITDD